ncbi:circularly permuted type 2 ATP-grasp protein [Nitrospirillum iridis]|uniref:Putative circularly permuted ATP-grasp superfamily protein/putative alpha-E superfamily protein n=1 Tax=Nitrospirillum iridis TaxID=765888 RepID=A0A7X0AXA0_9PROT|nr:circularly permuted type 2 ATP-grasp protein [Nitrospirillum iridis]MBB6250359.1 putative circularly permuted ATP-grasp superfamily protein/putative alpha-E superfamily protein [Nitrospirillum iridis]
MAEPPKQPPEQPSLFSDAGDLGYGTGPIFDEMVTGTGQLRPHWQQFFAAHGPFTPEQMAVKWAAARQRLFLNGVTFNSYRDPQGTERPWPLDPVPLLISSVEWRAISAGLVQRARLTEQVLADFYGPQTLLADGTVPPSLLYADPGYLRACQGLDVPGGRRLLLFAADLVRDGDGQWRVLTCRTEAPTGAGYALENRAVLSQTLADPFRACNVERLTSFFETLRASLARSAPQCSGVDGHPRAVLLTPGPFNEAYFEHAYLARHLRMTLAEGADMVVRDQAVYLKTLAGLERVDVILHRVDDAFCDPLELRVDSALGVPGLLQAVRAGSVAVVNALGSGMAESMALLSHMPALSQRLLGEELLLPNVQTYWGGDPAQREILLSQLDQMVVRPAFSSLAGQVANGPDLEEDARDDLAARIRARPQNWAGQVPVAPSTAPLWRDGRVEPRPLVVRAFVCANGEGGWTVMPGGLVRISADSRHAAVSLQEGGGSKDLWIVGSERPGTVRRLITTPPDGAREPSPVPGNLPSRAADHLFWVGRYAERAAAAVRLLRGATLRLSDDSRPSAREELSPLLRLMGRATLIPQEIAQLPDSDALRGMRQALEIVVDPANPGGLVAATARLRRAMGSVRDRLPSDTRQVLSRLDAIGGALVKADRPALALLLDDFSQVLAAQTGLELDSMPRGAGWRFLVLGRRLERSIDSVERLQAAGVVSERADAATLEVLLELAEAGPAYRERFPVGVQREAALSLLLTDPEHPHSLLFQLDTVRRQVGRLPALPAFGSATDTDPLARLADQVAQASYRLQDLALTRDMGLLSATLFQLGWSLPAMSNLLSQAYFSHVHARAA